MSVMPNSNSLSFAGLAMELDEKTLAQRFAEGDSAAFAAIVAIHRPRITRLVYRLLGWPSDVDDMVQEVFLAALTKCRKFRGESALATWLTVIALNKCRTHRRGLVSRWRTLRRASRRPVKLESAADAAVVADDTLALLAVVLFVRVNPRPQVVVNDPSKARRELSLIQIQADSQAVTVKRLMEYQHSLDIREKAARKLDRGQPLDRIQQQRENAARLL